MATFERRTDRHGKVGAIRAKVRQVGLPHLSRTFTVHGSGAAAVRKAEASARAWAAEVTASLRSEAPGPMSGASLVPMAWRQPAPVMAAWAQANAPDSPEATRGAGALPAPQGTSPLTDDAVRRLLAQAPDDNTRSLLRFVMSTGQPVDVLARLRWQHVMLAQRHFEVRSSTGTVLRRVPLTPAAADALLSHPGRKYGLVFFGGDAHAIATALRNCAAPLALDVQALYGFAAWRWLQSGVGPADAAAFMGLDGATGLTAPLQAAPIDPPPAPLRAGSPDPKYTE